MVASAFEFADICRKHDYHNFLFSMKASNPLVMAAAYRLLAEEMYQRGWDYPLHLGVTGAPPPTPLNYPPSRPLFPPVVGTTPSKKGKRSASWCAEAGEGEDGRMKSAIGIGSLLLDGLGDTIRVSLTEDPELELDPCRRLANLGTAAAEGAWGVEPFGETTRDTHAFSRRQGALPEQRESDGETDYRNVLHRCGPHCRTHCTCQPHRRVFALDRAPLRAETAPSSAP